jgi:argininosuccinate lyase
MIDLDFKGCDVLDMVRKKSGICGKGLEKNSEEVGKVDNPPKVVRSRLSRGMERLALEFSSSLSDDRNIFYYDILVDLAHVIGLYKKGYLTEDEVKKIVSALLKIRDEGYLELSQTYEDVHEAIEAKIIGFAGDAGAKMHTGRSRNDEVATCLRLYTRDRLLALMSSLIDLRVAIIELAEENVDVLLPGFTHLQYAQPTRLSHHLIAYHDMLWRDYLRALECFRRVNRSPLGSAAFASTSFELDRDLTAKLLGFDGIVENSMDAVSSRDFAIEAIFVCSSVMLSLSRIAEEIILWSSEFDFIELPDEYSSSSSIMPQKKNPDIAELVRGRTGRVCGNLISAMMIYKAMPFSYNRDFQEINPLIYGSLESAVMCCNLFSGMLRKIVFKRDIMKKKASKGFTTATELADTLVQKAGIPFRIAHKIVGILAMKGIFHPTKDDLMSAARSVLGEKVNILEKVTEKDIESAINPENVVERRKNIGSPSKGAVLKMIEKRKKKVEEDEESLQEIIEKVSTSLENLYDAVQRIVKESCGEC